MIQKYTKTEHKPKKVMRRTRSRIPQITPIEGPGTMERSFVMMQRAMPVISEVGNPIRAMVAAMARYE